MNPLLLCRDYAHLQQAFTRLEYAELARACTGSGEGQGFPVRQHRLDALLGQSEAAPPQPEDIVYQLGQAKKKAAFLSAPVGGLRLGADVDQERVLAGAEGILNGSRPPMALLLEMASRKGWHNQKPVHPQRQSLLLSRLISGWWRFWAEMLKLLSSLQERWRWTVKLIWVVWQSLPGSLCSAAKRFKQRLPGSNNGLKHSSLLLLVPVKWPDT